MLKNMLSRAEREDGWLNVKNWCMHRMLNMSTTINEIIYTSDGTADEILNTKSARENPYINYVI